MQKEATSPQNLIEMVNAVDWYHTIDLGNGIVTPGMYDHRPHLHYYNLPDDLHGKTVLDIGAASGFFSFEMERRGARVTATDLPDWGDHDFGPNYQPGRIDQVSDAYLRQPFDIAKAALGSKVSRKFINIYDISPETMGMFDMVFCGSVLIHLTDPVKAMWSIASVTKEKAIIATVIDERNHTHPTASMVGHRRGDVWWLPTKACLELMAVNAGFVGIEWVNEFQLDYRDGSPGSYHGVLHAYKTEDNWSPQTMHRDKIIARQEADDRARLSLEDEVARLRKTVAGYEQGRMMRLLNGINRILGR